MPFVSGRHAQMCDPHPGRVLHQLEFCQSVALHLEHEVGELAVIEVGQPSSQVVPEYPSVLMQSVFISSPRPCDPGVPAHVIAKSFGVTHTANASAEIPSAIRIASWMTLMISAKRSMCVPLCAR
jgi:hypothetical protein